MKKQRAILFSTVLILSFIMPFAQGAHGEGELSNLLGQIKTPSSVASLDSQSAVYDAQQNELEIQRTEVERQILSLERQMATLDGQSRSLVSQKALLPNRKEQEKIIAAYQLQVSYYNVALLYENLYLLDEYLLLLDKQIEVEETKLMLGESTQNAVEFLIASRISAEQNYISYLSQIEYEKQMITLQADSNVNSLVFKIPDTITEKSSRSVSELQNELVRNNISMLEQEASVTDQFTFAESMKYIGGSDDAYYLEALAQYNLGIAQKNAYKEQLMAYANGQYSENVKIEAQYQAAVARRDVFVEQRNILRTMYEQGEISEEEYLSDMYEISKSLMDIKSAVVAKANSLFMLDLLAVGIVLNVG